MSTIGNIVKGNVNDRNNGEVLSIEQTKELQRVLLMILEDVDSLCREYGIEYILIGGTAIGCVRHEGFIPWDDDVDIAMTRKDYEEFRRVISEKYHEKYRLTDAISKNNYGKNIPKLRLRDTVYKTLLKVEPEDEEITIDVFIIENVSDNMLEKWLQGILCLVMGYCLSCRRFAEQKLFFKDLYKGKNIKCKTIIGRILGFASLETWAYWCEKMYSMCKNHSSQYVTVPTDRRHFFGEIFPRKVMCITIDAKFENKYFKIPKEYDLYLTERYGDYMQIPPPEKRVLSKYSYLDFGKYKTCALGEYIE